MTQRYSKYKDSGIEWIGEIPEHWEVKRLNFISKVKSITNRTNEELLSVYLERGVIRFNEIEEKRTNVTSLDLTKYQLVEKGDLVLNNQQAWRGSVGVSNYIGIVSPAYIILELFGNFIPGFANLLFRDKAMVIHYLLNSKGVGTIQRNLYWPSLKDALIFLPPLPEQEAIAQFLDEKCARIDDAIRIKEKQIDLLKEYRQIAIHNAVTKGLNDQVKMKDSGIDWIGEIPEHWEVKKNFHISIINTGATPDRSIDAYWNGDILWIKTGEINYNLIIDTEEKISEKGLANSSTRLAKEGSIIMAMYGQGVTRGKVAIIGRPATYNQACCVIEYDKIVLPHYALFFYKSSYNFFRDAGNETSQMNLSSGYVGKLKISVPPLAEQAQIVARLETLTAKTDEAIHLKEQQIEQLKKYKNSLINEVVTGKIRVF
jgi:type I restriction enzyme S subunit